ncbi:hypothetical protein BU15DRAFT_71175 [Melanogaster broomeanus]|nr:hypothetical protein BU15DRAFT_71175 [Melanogaster broomeanus]
MHFSAGVVVEQVVPSSPLCTAQDGTTSTLRNRHPAVMSKQLKIHGVGLLELNHLVVEISAKQSKAKAEKMHRCLDAVLLLSNVQLNENGRLLGSGIKTALIVYALPKNEVYRHTSCTNASNAALGCLWKLTIHDTRGPATNWTSQRKPDVKSLKISSNGSDPSLVRPTTEPQEVPPSEQSTPLKLTPLHGSTRDDTQKCIQPATRSRLNCPSQADSDSCASKRSKTEDPTRNVTVQTVLYAVEMLSANIAVKHAINRIVRGDGTQLWYHDHRPISAGGSNSIQDLPCFLVLLYALQRFELEDWGRNTAFKPRLMGDNVKFHTVEVDGKELTLVDEERVTRFGLAGRGTDVTGITCEKLKWEKLAHETESGMVA